MSPAGQDAARPSGRGRWLLSGAVLLLLATTLPFLGKALGIDDPLYVEGARQVLAAPLHPLDGPSFWHERPTTLYHDLYNPPLALYLLAPAVAIGHGAEAPLHLWMIGFAVLALMAAAWTGAALGAPPRLVLLVAVSPLLAVQALSTTTDVPFLLLSLLAWGAALRGRAGLAGALVGLSALTRYAGLLNLPLALLALPPPRRSRLVPLLVPVLLLLGGFWSLDAAQHGRLHLLAAGGLMDLRPSRVLRTLISFAMALGLVGLPAVVGLLRWSRRQAAAALAAGVIGALLVHGETGRAASAALGFLAMGSGAALLWGAAEATAPASRGRLFLAAVVGAFAFQAVVPVFFGAARYALPALPALVWLLHAGGRLADRPWWRWALSVGASGILSFAVVSGDAGAAGAWRDLAARLPPGEKGVSVGHWGFQWYADRAGWPPLDPRRPLEAGERVALGRGIHAQPVSPALEARLGSSQAIAVASPLVRVMDRDSGAGLYSDAWGLLPFALRAGAREEVDLRTVVRGSPWAEAPGAVTLVDLGTARARSALLDGWSGDESFEENGARRHFVWGTAPESALRLALPAGTAWLLLDASPSREAEGPLLVSLGGTARVRIELEAGWRRYRVRVEGSAPAGLATVVLHPAGVWRPGPFSRERRTLTLAVDRIGFAATEGELTPESADSQNPP